MPLLLDRLPLALVRLRLALVDFDFLGDESSLLELVLLLLLLLLELVLVLLELLLLELSAAVCWVDEDTYGENSWLYKEVTSPPYDGIYPSQVLPVISNGKEILTLEPDNLTLISTG